MEGELACVWEVAACVRGPGGVALESSFKKLGVEGVVRGQGPWEGMVESVCLFSPSWMDNWNTFIRTT